MRIFKRLGIDRECARPGAAAGAMAVAIRLLRRTVFTGHALEDEFCDVGLDSGGEQSLDDGLNVFVLFAEPVDQA